MKERKKRTEKKERRITHYKINNLNGLEKYSLIFGEQLQRLRKINICSNLIVFEKYTSATTSMAYKNIYFKNKATSLHIQE